MLLMCQAASDEHMSPCAEVLYAAMARLIHCVPYGKGLHAPRPALGPGNCCRATRTLQPQRFGVPSPAQLMQSCGITHISE